VYFVKNDLINRELHGRSSVFGLHRFFLLAGKCLNDIIEIENAVFVAVNIGGDTLQVYLVHLYGMVQQLPHADIHFQLIACDECILLLIFEIDAVKHNHLGKADAQVTNLNFGMYLILEKGYGFILGKILHCGYLDRYDNEYQQHDHDANDPKDGFKSYASDSFQCTGR